jgi:hypothetical protein
MTMFRLEDLYTMKAEIRPEAILQQMGAKI